MNKQNEKLLGTQIESLTPEHGAEIVEFYHNNGFDTTKLIRKKGITTPVIALTAFDKQEITEQSLSCGMNDIIIKPFEQGKLFQVINNLVTKKNVD